MIADAPCGLVETFTLHPAMYITEGDISLGFIAIYALSRCRLGGYNLRIKATYNTSLQGGEKNDSDLISTRRDSRMTAQSTLHVHRKRDLKPSGLQITPHLKE